MGGWAGIGLFRFLFRRGKNEGAEGRAPTSTVSVSAGVSRGADVLADGGRPAPARPVQVPGDASVDADVPVDGGRPAPARPVQVPGDASVDADVLVDGIGDLALEILAQSSDNAVCSAFSIFEAWLRVWAGARGTCRDELSAALGRIQGEDDVRGRLDELMRSIAGATNDACSIENANAIWVRPGLPLQPEFEKRWGGATQELDLSDPRRAADVVNTWVAERTHGMIRDIVKPEMITPALLIANAIYLNAEWSDKFDKSSTEDRDFELADQTLVQVPTMQLSARFRCARTDDFDLLVKPYAGAGLSFLVVPPHRGKLNDVRASLRWAALRAALAASEHLDVRLRLPTFSISSSPEVDAVLQGRGANAVYASHTANLSGLSPGALEPGRELFVGGTAHHARIDVHEDGTEAAAATVVVLAVGGAPSPMPRPPYEFFVDRPFLFFIVDAAANVPLFSGQVTRPSSP